MLILLALITMTMVSAWADRSKNRSKSYKGHVYEKVWVILASLFSEGTSRPTFSRVGQILLCVWLLSVFILNNLMVSQFEAALVQKENDDYMRTIQDVANRQHLTPMFVKNTAAYIAIAGSELERARIIHRRAESNPEESYVSLAQALSPSTYQKAKDGKAVVFGMRNIFQIILSLVCLQLKNERSLYFLEEEMYPHHYSPVLRKDFPKADVETSNIRIHRILEGDFYNHWDKPNTRNFWKCGLETEKHGDDGLGLAHLWPVFLLLAACHFMSFLVLLAEKVVFRMQQRPSEPHLY